ncbi:MAG: hypothetical protein IT160_18415 [Bryobacterales bacterium]|nr:hypothetical protein [Bryobacterales bacterium]
MTSGLTRFILWDYPRAGWQYDIMVGLILLFIFVTPREFFRDQPRSNAVRVLAPEHGIAEYWVEPAALAGLSEGQRWSRTTELIRQRFGRKQVVRLEPIFNEEQEIRGYIAYTKP